MKEYYIKITSNGFYCEFIATDIEDIDIINKILDKVKKQLALNEIEKINDGYYKNRLH